MRTLTGKDYIIPSLALVSIIVLLIIGPVPQNLSYHSFADQRSAFGIPNFLNVVTNLPFAWIAFMGFRIMKNSRERKLKQIVFLLFSGFLLLTFGSGYYHLWSNNETLIYDRIPITIILMSFFAFIIYDCISQKKGILLSLFSTLSGY